MGHHNLRSEDGSILMVAIVLIAIMLSVALSSIRRSVVLGHLAERLGLRDLWGEASCFIARFVLVVMSDGYTAADMPKYRAHVDKHLNVLWSIEPFRSYRHYFNVYRLEIVSQDSGISCDPDDGNVRRNTPEGKRSTRVPVQRSHFNP